MPRFFPPFLPYKYKACLAWTYPYPYSIHSRLSPSDCLLGVTAYTYMSASRAWKTRLLGASGGGGVDGLEFPVNFELSAPFG